MMTVSTAEDCRQVVHDFLHRAIDEHHIKPHDALAVALDVAAGLIAREPTDDKRVERLSKACQALSLAVLAHLQEAKK